MGSGIFGGIAGIMQGNTNLLSAEKQAAAMRAQGNWTKSQYDFNADMADLQSKDAIDRGNIEGAREGMKVNAAIGKERATAGASGVDPNTGSSAEVQKQTAGIGALDELNIRNNAMRQSFGFQAQALADRGQGKFAKVAADTNADNTLLLGGMNAAAAWLRAMGDFSGMGAHGGSGAASGATTGGEAGGADFSGEAAWGGGGGMDALVAL